MSLLAGAVKQDLDTQIFQLLCHILRKHCGKNAEGCTGCGDQLIVRLLIVADISHLPGGKCFLYLVNVPRVHIVCIERDCVQRPDRIDQGCGRRGRNQNIAHRLLQDDRFIACLCRNTHILRNQQDLCAVHGLDFLITALVIIYRKVPGIFQLHGVVEYQPAVIVFLCPFLFLRWSRFLI